MSKYIIELDDRIKLVTSVGVTDNGVVYTTSDYVHNLEELNSDYINEHYGSLQDEAYQAGLNDAWEAVRKIAFMDTETSENVTGYFGLFRIMENLTPMQAIEKLKAYEDGKHSDRIEVGDEVINNTTGTKGILLEPETEDLLATVVVPNHRWNTFNMSHINLTKTGRHFDIEGILEAMKNG